MRTGRGVLYFSLSSNIRQDHCLARLECSKMLAGTSSKSKQSAAQALVQVLSSILLTPEKFVQRCGVTSSIGEQAILTFELVQQVCLLSAYKGVQVV